MSCLKLQSVVFEFVAGSNRWRVMFHGSRVFVNKQREGVSPPEDWMYNILDKSLKPCETHAKRIVSFASGGTEMPMQRVLSDGQVAVKPCLEVAS